MARDKIKQRKRRQHHTETVKKEGCLRFCDPGACRDCLYIGEGDFLCEQDNVIVVSDWEPTKEYLHCKANRPAYLRKDGKNNGKK